jgi:hypothetical protein
MFLFDVAPEGTGAAGYAAIAAFVFVILASAAVAFLVLRKTVKMAIRMMVVGAVLVIAIVGGIALWLFAAHPKNNVKPNRPAYNAPK